MYDASIDWIRRMNSYHRGRWLLLAASVLMALMSVLWLTGASVHIVVWARTQSLPNRYYSYTPNPWAANPVSAFLTPDHLLLSNAQSMIVLGALTILLAAGAQAYFQCVRTRIDHQPPWHRRWLASASHAVVLAIVTTYPLALAIYFLHKKSNVWLGWGDDGLVLESLLVGMAVWTIVLAILDWSWRYRILALELTLTSPLVITMLFGFTISRRHHAWQLIPILCAGTWTLCVLTRLAFAWPECRRRLDLNLCESCGYDLRGTVEAGRGACPECGAPVSTR